MSHSDPNRGPAPHRGADWVQVSTPVVIVVHRPPPRESLARAVPSGRTVTTAGWQTGAAFVVVSLERGGEDIDAVVDALEPLGIRAEIVARGHQVRRAPSVVVRVPADRVADAIVALETRGFIGVLAYEPDAGSWEGPGSENQRRQPSTSRPPRRGR
jgi:hypothetical protein